MGVEYADEPRLAVAARLELRCAAADKEEAGGIPSGQE